VRNECRPFWVPINKKKGDNVVEAGEFLAMKDPSLHIFWLRLHITLVLVYI